jgi:predicted ATPase
VGDALSTVAGSGGIVSDWAIGGVKSAETTLRLAEEVLSISDKQGFSLLLAGGKSMRGWCLGAMGQPAEAIPLMLQGLDNSQATGASLLVPFFLTTLAEVYGMAAQADEGLKRLAEAAKIIEATQERWAEAEMHRLRGTLLLSMNERAPAEDSFRLALTVAQQQNAKFWELRAATSLVRLWRDQGKRQQAHDLLAPVYRWFTEGFNTLDLKEAKTLLNELTR